MALNPSDYATVKADIAANSDLNSQANNSDGDASIAQLYNALASPPFPVWNPKTPVGDIFNAISWDKYTPVDSVPAADTNMTFSDRLLMIQTKQFNLQSLLQGSATFGSNRVLDASLANIRSALRDAVINLPAGTSGANVSAGGASGVTVMTACTRNATRIEKLLAPSSASLGGVTANLMTFEGPISASDVRSVRNS